ncbi:MAG: HAD hydrolase-like protein, partial [Candidatus Woesearchaeota archaeon]
MKYFGENKLNKKLNNLKKNKIKKYKLILFDFDGTLLDILPHIVPFFNNFSKRYNFLPISNPDLTRDLTLNQII